ncbi:MAG: tetratricopeptide repeat protein [Bacteroidota bacterium]|nr:tetratricopeptide repeat protein [Bacteroidota bacterium]
MKNITNPSLKKSHNDTTISKGVSLAYNYVNGVKEKLLGNLDNAATIFNKCLKMDKNNSACMYELANIYTIQKKYKEALNLSKSAVEIEKDNIWYQIQLSDLYEKNKQYKNAALIYEQIIKKNPEKIELYYKWAEELLYSGKYTDAIKVYNLIEKRIGITEEISIQKEQIYLKLNKLKDAISEVEKLINAFPKELKYLNILSELYQNNNSPEKAYEIYNKILEKDPNNGLVHLSLANYYKQKGQKDKAFDELKSAFSRKELDIDTKINILLSYFVVTDKYTELKDQAYELLKILVTVHPHEAKAHSMYGDFLYRDKKLTDARDEFKKVIALDSSKYMVWEQLLYTESELGDNIALKNDSKRAINLFPLQPGLYLLNGSSNFQLNNLEEAINSLNEGLKLSSFDKNLQLQFYTFLGDIYNKKKEYDKSDENYQNALKIDADNSYVLNNYSYYLSLRKKDLDKAENMARKAVDNEPKNDSYLDTYAWVLYIEGKFKEAKIWEDKAMTNGGEKNGTILEHYGDILFKLNEIDKAVLFWEKARKAGGTTEFIDKKITDRKLYE